MLLEQVTIQEKKQLLLNKGISQNVIDKLLQCDPTNKGKTDADKVGSYTDWIVNRYLKNRWFTNFDKLQSQLQQYDKSKHKIPDKQMQNIGYFNSLIDLIIFVNNNQDKLAIESDEFIVKTETDHDMFYSKDFVIHVPHTKEQSIRLGSGTKWCTSQKYNNMFDEYYRKGYLFYITNKSKKQERYNLHLKLEYEEIEFADDKNRHLTYKLFDIVKQDNTLIPQIKKYFEYENVKIDPDNKLNGFLQCQTVQDIVQWYDQADIYFETDEQKIINMFRIIEPVSIIEFIPHPNNRIKIQQIQSTDPVNFNNLISLIEDFDEECQMQQVLEYGDYIIDIIKSGIIPSEEIQIQQINNSDNIQDILEVMNDNHIQYSEQVQIQQINNNVSYIYNIENPTKNAMLYQLSINADEQIEYIIDKRETITKELQMQQVTNSEMGSQIYSLLYNNISPDEDVLLQQIENNPDQIEYINDFIDDSQLENIDYDSFLKKQIQTNEYILEYLPNVSEEIQLYQIRYNRNFYNLIKNPTPKQTQLYNQLRLFNYNESASYISKLLGVN